MIKKIALGVSVLLHPLIIPTTGIIVLLFSGTYISAIPFSAKKVMILLTFSGTCLLPALTIPFFYMRGMIKDIRMPDQDDRMLPLSLTLIFYLLTYFLFISMPIYRFMRGFMLASLLEVLFALLISFRWKISLHMIGVGGLTAFLILSSLFHQVNLLNFIIFSIAASGITGTARLILEAHTIQEVAGGFVIGALVMGGCLGMFM